MTLAAATQIAFDQIIALNAADGIAITAPELRVRSHAALHDGFHITIYERYAPSWCCVYEATVTASGNVCLGGRGLGQDERAKYHTVFAG